MSNFKAILRKVKGEDDPSNEDASSVETVALHSPAPEPIEAVQLPPTAKRKERVKPAETHRGRGRPASGKRSDPEYSQITAYVRTKTHTAVKIKLLKQSQFCDASELAEYLFNQWLKTDI